MLDGGMLQLPSRTNKKLDDMDLFVSHPANQSLLEQFRERIDDSSRSILRRRHRGNTVFRTTPIALKQADKEGRVQPDRLVMPIGFGAVYSWGATLIRWV
jgi:3-oxoacyl-[acyl-carrier-protein] synthase III